MANINSLYSRLNMVGPWLKIHFPAGARKIGLDLGLGCPHRIAGQGCIFCSPYGSSQFTELRSIENQLQAGIDKLSRKKNSPAILAYFQAHTSTNAPAETLRQTFIATIENPCIQGLIISTRPDSLEEKHWDLLEELNNRGKMFWLELGLQSSHNQTLSLINRGHSVDSFIKATEQAQSRKIKTVCHLILGLPQEDIRQVEETILLMNSLKIWGVKLHALMVLQQTQLHEMWQNGHYVPWSLGKWVEVQARALSLLAPETVIHRLIADPGKGEVCLAPDWILNKNLALSKLAEYMEIQNLIQGCDYK